MQMGFLNTINSFLNDIYLKMLEKQKCSFTNYVALNFSALFQSLVKPLFLT